jgi:flagellar basal-body rod protein FlgG
MSIQALYTAATGMTSLQNKLDVTANNLANSQTVGFKRDRANFEDLFYRTEKFPGAQDSASQYTPVGIQYGTGSRVQSVQSDFTQGSYQTTGGQLDVAISGNGFFQIMDPSGTIYYTRAGNFSKNATGDIVLASANIGRKLEPTVSIPTDAQDIVISPEGAISIRLPTSQQLQQIGQFQLVSFVNPQGLLKIGENLYQQTDASGAPAVTANPGQQGLGLLQQNTLEQSNVQPVQELLDLITTQRSFEMNSQAVKAADDILQTIDNLPRF